MSDNVSITAGSGTDVATDDVAGIQYQRVKITLGADGAADTDVDSGQQTMALSVPVVLASDHSAIAVSGTFTTTPPANATTNISQINGVTPLMGAGNTGTGSPRVTIASDQAAVAISDGGGSITVDGTVQVTNSLESYAEDTVHVTGDIGVMTLAVRKSTAADLSAGATDGDYEPLEVDASGRLWVHVGAAEPGTAATSLGKAEDGAHTTGDTGVMMLAVRAASATDFSAGATDGDYEPLQVNASGALRVHVETSSVGSTTDTEDGTVAAAQASVALTIGQEYRFDGTNWLRPVAHDAVDNAGSPYKIGARAETSTKGVTLVADGDVTHLYADSDGILITKQSTSWGDLISERVSNTDGASTGFSTFDNAAGTHNYITSVTIHNAHATTMGFVDFRDGTGGSVIWTFPAPATGGTTHNFNPPLRQPTAATALAFDVSAAITTIYISVAGFKSKV